MFYPAYCLLWNLPSEMSFGEAIEQGVLPEPIYTTGIYEVNEIVKEY